MNSNISYHMPTKIVYEIDSLNKIDEFINERKTLLVTTSGFINRGLLETLKEQTSSIVYVVSNIKSHPEFKDLEFIYEDIKDIDFELILAVGGGSVLDASKFLSVSNEKKEFSFVKDICKNKIEKKDYTLIPIIAVPTTSGTGSELTPWATIWDMQEKKKYSLHLKDLFSEVAIYDPSLTLSIPRDITIQTALDTLSHSLESIWNKNANEITINYAIKSAKLIMKYIQNLSDNLDSLEYRDNIMKACMYSALAFSNTQTAIAHALSYYITANKNIPHGIACSFTLPLLIDSVIGKYDFIDEALGKIFKEVSSLELRELFKNLGISTNFSDYGIQKYELGLLVSSLQNNQRAGNSLVDIDFL